MISDLSLTDSQIADLAAGYGDADAMEVLRQGQYDRFLQVLASISELAPERKTDQALRLLEDARLLDESAYVQALSYPHILVWSSVALDALMGMDAEADRDVHLSHLSAVAATVAYQCGLEFEINIPVIGDCAVLPGIGAAFFEGIESDEKSGIAEATVLFSQETLTLSCHGEKVEVPKNPFVSTINWHGVRRVEVESNGLVLELVIDDVDPYRHYNLDASRYTPADRLDDVGYKTWRELIADAWMLVTSRHQEYAEGIAAALRVIVPVSTDGRPMNDSSTFGAITVADISHRWMAHAMLYELQRSKVKAVHYLTPLHRALLDEKMYLAPWVVELVPFGRFFEAAYAARAMVEYWYKQSQTAVEAEERTRALMLFALWRSRVDACRVHLLESDELTQLGNQFANAIPLSSSLPSLESVSDEIQSFARVTEADHRISIRLKNLIPEEATIGRLVAAWQASESAPLDVEIRNRIQQRMPMRGWQCRRWLGVRKVADADWFVDILENENYLRTLDPSADPLDALAVDGQLDQVVSACCERIVQRSAIAETWALLALACRGQRDLASSALVNFPEVVYELYAAIDQEGVALPDPLEVAAWVAPLLLRQDATQNIPKLLT